MRGLRTIACLALLLLVGGDAAARRRPPPPRAPEAAHDLSEIDFPRESPEERLARGKQSFLRNDFGSAIAAVHDLLYPEVRLRTDEDVQTAHRVLALAYLFVHEEKKAAAEFNALLQLKPDFALDPVVDPPLAIAFLDRLKREEENRMRDIERMRREEAEAAAREAERRRLEEEERIRRALKPVVVQKTVEQHHRFIALVPFGAGQFQNGQARKGWALLGTELGLGVISLATWTGLSLKYQAGRIQVPPEEVGTATAFSVVSVTTGALFWAAVAYGIIDGLVYFKSEVERGEKVLPPDTVPPGAPQSRLRLRLPAPSIAPDGSGGGVTLQGTF